jgi:amino acid transporter
MALLFILIVPWLFSVPMALASAEMATAMPVEGGFYRWTRAAFGNFWGFQCGWWNWTGTFFMWMRSATSVLTLLSLWRLRRVAPETKPSFVVPGGKAGLAAVVVVPTVLFAWALINSDPASRLRGIACLALGPAAFYSAKRRQVVASAVADRVDVPPRINA